MIQSSIMDFSRAKDGADSTCLQGAHSLTGRPAGGTTPPKAIPCKDSLPMGMTETQSREQWTPPGVGMLALLQPQVTLGGWAGAGPPGDGIPEGGSSMVKESRADWAVFSGENEQATVAKKPGSGCWWCWKLGSQSRSEGPWMAYEELWDFSHRCVCREGSPRGFQEEGGDQTLFRTIPDRCVEDARPTLSPACLLDLSGCNGSWRRSVLAPPPQ